MTYPTPEFTLTHHATTRILERGLPPPTKKMKFTSPGPKTRRRIREHCRANGYDFGKMYWIHNSSIVYVCEILDANKYLVITAFDLNDGTK